MSSDALPPAVTSAAVPDTVAYLAGRWSVARDLSDGTPDGTGRFTGTAHFRETGEGHWLHEERGLLEWRDLRRAATRTLRLLAHPDGTADVQFEDGRPFHFLDLRTGRWHAHHPCAEDRYRGTFTVLGPDSWHLRWKVHGPAKNQLLESRYRRTD